MEKMLRETAEFIRLELERLPFAGDLRHLQVLENFPYGCCQGAAYIYMYYLKNHKAVKPNLLYLLANAEIKPGQTHAWARVGGFHVDLTGDQFGKEKVIVKAGNPWVGIHSNPCEYAFAEEKLSDSYRRELKAICNHIQNPHFFGY